MKSAPASTRNAEQVDMFAARMAAIMRPSMPGAEQQPAGEAKGVLGIAELSAARVSLRDDRGHDEADERPADRADTLHHVAVEHARRGRSRSSRPVPTAAS